jgi:type II secretory pathway component GspD/PulD (secretin)
VTERTVYLNNVSQQAEANEIVTALRNALSPCDKIYLIPSQGAIVMEAPPDQLALAQKIIADLDRPKKNYRLIYSVTEMDGGKQIGAQDYAMIITSGQTTSLKLGNKVPVATGSTGTNQTSFTYIDIGMNFDATLTEMGNNAMLKSSVEQSSVAPQQSDIAGVKEPIMRQASLRGESLLAPGKPLMLGSLDIPGSTSHLQIEVLMAPLP